MFITWPRINFAHVQALEKRNSFTMVYKFFFLVDSKHLYDRCKTKASN